MEKVVETEDEVKTVTEEAVAKTREAMPEQTPVKKDAPAQKQASKHEIAKARISQAASTLNGVDTEIEACMQKVEEDLARFKQAEEVLVSEGLRPARQALKELGVTEKLIESAPAPKVDLDDPELKPVEIKKISSGRGAGLFWGVTGVVAALAGWCYTATQALGLPLLPAKVPDMERINAVLGWTAAQMGQGENVAVGGTVVGIAAVVILILIYWIVTALRGSSNLKVAEKIEADTEFYCTKKEECKEQMKRVREHIANAQKTVEKYTVLLAEQNASLARARFIEEADTYDRLHAKTKQTVGILQQLSDEIESFLETPMAEHGILSKEGIEVLERVNKTANDYVMGLYA